MSYPAAEDIGYDPSLYIQRTANGFSLVRDLLADGQPKLHIGMIRSIDFRMTEGSTLRFHYRVDTAGHGDRFQLLLAGDSRRKYSFDLRSAAGEHSLVVHGSDLDIPPRGDDIAAIVLEGIVLNSPRGARNRVILQALDIDAYQPASIPIESPGLEIPVADALPVANVVIKKDDPQLALRISGTHRKVNVALFNGKGEHILERSVGRGVIDLGSSSSPGLWTAHLSTGDRSVDFRFLVLGEVPAHPRLLLTSDRLAQLRREMPSKVLSELIEKKASDAAKKISPTRWGGDNIPFMSRTSLLSGLTQYFDLLDQYGDAISLNALDFRLTGSDESLQIARAALLTAVRWATWTPPWFQAHGLQSYYEAGIFAQKVSFGYDLIADRMSAAEKQEIANAFYEKAVIPVVRDYFSNDRMPIADSNHMAHSLGGAIAACVAVYGDVPDWSTRFGPALAKLIAAYEHLLRDMFLSDGSEAESIDYQEFAMRGLTIGAAALARIGILPLGTDRLLNSFWWPYYAQYKPGYELDTGDDIGTLFAHSGFAWAAEVSKDPALTTFYESAPARTVASVLQSASDSPEAPSITDLVCCTMKGARPPSVPESRVFEQRGSAALRDGWSSESTLVSIRVGPWMNHGHNDEGSFQIASHGKVLIGEAGYTSYYSDPRFADYFIQAVGHNTILVDGNPFSQSSLAPTQWRTLANSPEFTDHILTDGFDFVEADLKPAYTDYDLTHYTRQYLFLKPDLFFVRDSIGSRTKHSYTFLLHPGPDIQPVVSGSRATLNDGEVGAVVLATPGTENWIVAPAPAALIAQNQSHKATIHPQSVMKLETSAASSAEFVLGMQLLPRGSSPSSITSFSFQNASGFAAGSTHVLFRDGAGDLASSGYTTDGTILLTVEGKDSRVFTADAHQLRSIHGSGFLDDDPIDAELTQTSNVDRWQIFCNQLTSVELGTRAVLQSATLDGASVYPSKGGHAVEVKLQPGEHRVELHY